MIITGSMLDLDGRPFAGRIQTIATLKVTKGRTHSLE